MSNDNPKITFNNKQDSYILNQNSRFVLTADNVNEIKNVVNALSDKLSNVGKFSHIFKYIRFALPTLNDNSNYDFIVELADNEKFIDNASKNLKKIQISLSTDSRTILHLCR